MNAILLKNAAIPLVIIAGEGEIGTSTAYTGKRTARAIKARLTRERSNGDRWAKCKAIVNGIAVDIAE